MRLNLNYVVKLLGLGLIFLGVSAMASGVGLFFFRNPGLNPLFFRSYAWLAFRWLGIRVDASGREVLDGIAERREQVVYMANHQSGIDLVTIGMLCPSHTLLVGKKELFWIPFFGLYFWLAGNTFIDRKRRGSAIHTLGQAVRAMRARKWSLAIMPEGTRNTTSDPLLPFKKGGFHVALETQLPIVPVVSSSVKEFVDFGRGVLKPGRIRVRVGTPIPTQGMGPEDLEKLMTTVRTRMLEMMGDLRAPT